MRHLLARLAAVALTLGIASCGSDDGPDITWFRAIHTMPDAPNVRVFFQNYVFRQTLSYGIAGSEIGDSLRGSSGTTSVMTVEYFDPGNVVGGVLYTLEVPFEVDTISTVVLAGTFENPEPFVVRSPRRDRPLNLPYFQFAHAAPELGAVDVYVTAPDTELASTAPLARVEPLGYSESIPVEFGQIRVRLTTAGTLDVLMDSGKVEFPEQSGPRGIGGEWLITIAPDVSVGPSPVFLVLSTGRLSTSLRDVGTPASLRAVHASPDAPAVDLVAATEPAQTLLQGLQYRAESPLIGTPAGVYALEFRIPGQDSLVTSPPEIFLPASDHSVFLIDELENARALVNQTSRRSVANEARLQFANLAPDSKFLSAYLTTSADQPFADGELILRDLRFSQVGIQLPRKTGEFFLTVTERFYENPQDAQDAQETILIGPVPFELVGGDVLLLAFYPAENPGEPEVLVKYDERLR
jgi:hypothetical protein